MTLVIQGNKTLNFKNFNSKAEHKGKIPFLFHLKSLKKGSFNIKRQISFLEEWPTSGVETKLK